MTEITYAFAGNPFARPSHIDRSAADAVWSEVLPQSEIRRRQWLVIACIAIAFGVASLAYRYGSFDELLGAILNSGSAD